jgi:hypothetical protein
MLTLFTRKECSFCEYFLQCWEDEVIPYLETKNINYEHYSLAKTGNNPSEEEEQAAQLAQERHVPSFPCIEYTIDNNTYRFNGERSLITIKKFLKRPERHVSLAAGSKVVDDIAQLQEKLNEFLPENISQEESWLRASEIVNPQYRNYLASKYDFEAEQKNTSTSSAEAISSEEEFIH